jgi:hypothetical protein
VGSFGFLALARYIVRGIARRIDEAIMSRRAQVDQRLDQIHQELKRMHDTMDRGIRPDRRQLFFVRIFGRSAVPARPLISGTADGDADR